MKQLQWPLALSLAVLMFAISAGCAESRKQASESQEQVNSALAGLTWLVGKWVHTSGDATSEEHWSPPRDGVMVGKNRQIVRGQMAFFEDLRIEAAADGIHYLASPQGRQPPTDFKMTESGRRRVVFENPSHDFPQRIIYRLDDNAVLHARIEGVENGRPRASEWTWERAPDRTSGE